MAYDFIEKIREGYQTFLDGIYALANPLNPISIVGNYNALEEISQENSLNYMVCFSKRGKGGKEGKKSKGGVSTHTGKKSGSKVTVDKSGTKHIHRKRRGSR